MPTNEVTDAALTRRARRGDAYAWRALVRRHAPLVYRLARRTLGSEADAEDAAQEAFVRMHRSLDRYDPSRPLSPWLGRITYNVCLKRLGKAARRPADSVEPARIELADDARAPSPERAAAAREAGTLVAAAVDTLSAQDRFLVTLRYREGLSDGEVAEAAGMNVNTVRTRLFRARKALRQVLSPELRRGALEEGR